MAFNNTHGAATAICDMCGTDWWKGYEDVQPLFVSRGAALRLLVSDFMWTITEHDDGSLAMLCAPCQQIEDCVRDGHHWVDLIYTIDGETNKYGETCARCSVVRSFDTPPADHPECMSIELPREQEEWLAALDAELFPDTASEEV